MLLPFCAGVLPCNAGLLELTATAVVGPPALVTETPLVIQHYTNTVNDTPAR